MSENDKAEVLKMFKDDPDSFKMRDRDISCKNFDKKGKKKYSNQNFMNARNGDR